MSQELIVSDGVAEVEVDGVLVDANGEPVVCGDDVETGSVLPVSTQAEGAKSLERRLWRAHGRVVKASLNCLRNARDAGDAGFRLKELGRGCLKQARERLGISERTLRVYMQVSTHWNTIQAAIDAGDIAGESIREALSLVKEVKDKESNGGAADDDDANAKSTKPLTPEVMRGSLHIICKNPLLEFAMAELAVSGFSYHSTLVAVLAGHNGCSTEAIFLVNGVRGGAEPEPEGDEFGDWIEAAGERECVVKLIAERTSVVWPDGEIKSLLD